MHNNCFEGKVDSPALVESVIDKSSQCCFVTNMESITKGVLRLRAARLRWLHPFLRRDITAVLIILKKVFEIYFLSGKYFSKPTLRLSSSSPSPFSLSVFNWFILNTWFVHKLCFWIKSNLKICQYDHCFIIWPILQGCVELLSLLNTAGDQEDFHLHSFSEIEDQPSNIPLPHPKQKF